VWTIFLLFAIFHSEVYAVLFEFASVPYPTDTVQNGDEGVQSCWRNLANA